MTLVLTPGDLPKNIEFKILDIDTKESFFRRIRNNISGSKKPSPNADISYKLKNILKKYCPTSKCLGIQNNLHDGKNQYHLIIFQAEIVDLHKKLLKNGWHEEKIIIMPLPIFDFWAYWNQDHMIHTSDNGSIDLAKCLNSEIFLQDLLNRKMSLPDENALKPIYPSKNGLSFRSELGVEGGCATHFYPYPSLDPSVKNNLDKINFIADSFSDKKSKDIYKKTMLGTPYDVMEHYFESTPKHLQYFEYLNVQPEDSIINCGVDAGFEIPFFCALMQVKGNIYNIDPDGFDRLQPYCKEFADIHKDILHQTRFYMGGKVGEMYVDKKDFTFTDSYSEGLEKASLITIDHFVAAEKLNKIDIIKMDVEGGELPATPHMLDTIKKFRPQLAIAVYHGAKHFWEIPEMLIKNCQDYNFYFNIYSYAHFEGIFYGIPKEKDKKAA